MQQQVKINLHSEGTVNPETLRIILNDKQVQIKKRKFKIKSYRSQSIKSQEAKIDTNPIYIGLCNDEQLKLNEKNIGPWIHQNKFCNNQYKSSLKNHFSSEKSKVVGQLSKVQFDQIKSRNNFQTYQQNISIKSAEKNTTNQKFYLKIPFRKAILEQQEGYSDELPKIKTSIDSVKLISHSLELKPDDKLIKNRGVKRFYTSILKISKQQTSKKQDSQKIFLKPSKSERFLNSIEQKNNTFNRIRHSRLIYNDCFDHQDLRQTQTSPQELFNIQKLKRFSMKNINKKQPLQKKLIQQSETYTFQVLKSKNITLKTSSTRQMLTDIIHKKWKNIN